MEALNKKKSSLLAAGIVSVEGNFERGDLVDVFDTQENRLGSGITNYNAGDVVTIQGMHSRKIAGILGFDYGAEVIHRNNLVMV